MVLWDIIGTYNIAVEHVIFDKHPLVAEHAMKIRNLHAVAAWKKAHSMCLFRNHEILKSIYEILFSNLVCYTSDCLQKIREK